MTSEVIIMAHYATEPAVKSLPSSVNREASQLVLGKQDSKQCLTDLTAQIVQTRLVRLSAAG